MNERKIKVSVIIPCYNVETYLSQCLDSALNQTLEEIEIICVNDGSTDKTPAILEEYASKDERIKIISKKNAGYGHTMNLGIASAKGEYIAFLESDDFIKLEAYQELYEKAVEFEADIIKGHFYEIRGKNSEQEVLKKITHKQELFNTPLQLPQDKELYYVAMMNCLGLFKRSFLRENQIIHNETPGASQQDIGFWFQTIVYAKTVILVDKGYYCYRKDNENSSIHDRGKVFVVNHEYDFIMQKLMERPDVFKANEAGFWHRRFSSYIFKMGRIDDVFQREYINKMANDFLPIKDYYATATVLFKEEEKHLLEQIIGDPEHYYFTNMITTINHTNNKSVASIEVLKEYKYDVSVIIPVFNTEEYLIECLDSVSLQIFDNFEIICIDDGSTDHSFDMLLEYQKSHPNMSVNRIEHAGQSAARNAGLRMAKGKYIYFMDSDDKIVPRTLERLFSTAETKKTDVVYFDGSTFFDNALLAEKFSNYYNAYERTREYGTVTTGIELFSLFVEDNVYQVSPCLQFFKYDFLASNNILFYEGIIYEDNLFTMQSILAAQRVTHLKEALFQRRVRPLSTISNTTLFKNFYGYFTCWIQMTTLLSTMKINIKYEKHIAKVLDDIYAAVIKTYNSLPEKEVEKATYKLSPIEMSIFKNAFIRNNGKELERVRGLRAQLLEELTTKRMEIDRLNRLRRETLALHAVKDREINWLRVEVDGLGRTLSRNIYRKIRTVGSKVKRKAKSLFSSN